MKKYIVLMICLALSLALCGCLESSRDTTSVSDDGEISVAVVSRVSSNFGAIPVNTAQLNELLSMAAHRYGNVFIIRDDGAPDVVASYRVSAPTVSGLSKERINTEEEKTVNTIKAGFSETVAKTPEVDTLRAIELGAQSLESQSGEKYLIVMDSGLSTTGYLNFTTGILRAKPDDVVSALERAHAIPDLKDVHVIWLFMGQVQAPQQTLSNIQLDNLREIWNALLTASGAADVDFRNDDRTILSSLNNLPSVSLVEADERVPENIPVMDTVVLDSENVRFVGDLAIFSDPDTAEKAIGTVAQSMRQHPDSNVFVVGTTAGKASDFAMNLSKERAEAVMTVLVAKGIDENRMICVGIGPNDPWHIIDTDSNGKLIEHLAEQNRKVLIIDTHSADAALLEIVAR